MLTSARAAAVVLALCASSCSQEPPPPAPPARPTPSLGGVPLAGNDAVAKTYGFTDCQVSANLDYLTCKRPGTLQFDETKADFAEVKLNIEPGGAATSGSYSGITFYFSRNSNRSECTKPKRRRSNDPWSDVLGSDCPLDSRLDTVLNRLQSRGWVASPRGRTLFHPDEPYYLQHDRGTTQGASPHITIIPLDDNAAAMAKHAFSFAKNTQEERTKAATLVEKMRPAK